MKIKFYSSVFWNSTFYNIYPSGHPEMDDDMVRIQIYYQKFASSVKPSYLLAFYDIEIGVRCTVPDCSGCFQFPAFHFTG